jgi:hypothetical protein
MNGLFLGGSRSIFLEIAILCEFDERLGILRGRGLIGKGRLKLSVDNDIGISADRRGEMSVKRDIKGVMTVLIFRNFASDKILGALHRLDE